MPIRREAMASRYDSEGYRLDRQSQPVQRGWVWGGCVVFVVDAGGGELGAGAGPGLGGGGGGAAGWGGGGGGAVRWAEIRWPVTTMRWVFSCLGWQANSVIVGSVVGLAIHVASGVTMKVWVTA